MTRDKHTPYGFTDEELVRLPMVYRDGLFTGRVVAVSGAGSGLGKAIAVLYARLGARLAICGRDADKLERSAQLLRSLGAETLAFPMTICEPEQVAAFMDRIFERFGRLDVLVNNAGGQFAGPALDFSPRGWQAVIDTNLNGSWYMMQAAARHWVERQVPARIVNIVSTIWRGRPSTAHSCAARAGVVYLSKTLAVEWAPHRIQVNCVAPGVVESSGFSHYPPEGLATYWGEANVMKRPGDAQDIAEACVYLSASSGKFITGEVVTVDGGQQLWGDPWSTGRPDYFRIDGAAAPPAEQGSDTNAQ